MQQPTYENLEDEKKDREYFLKKMNWSPKQLDDYLNQKEIPHDFYGTEKNLWAVLNKIYSKLKNIFKII